MFQIDRAQLSIYWSSFVDIETFGHSSHYSAILKYEYAIGECCDARRFLSHQ